jgi:predicted alpha/beta hydrolase family esterase
VNFFSGFSLQGESFIFDEYLKKGDYVVSGFSLGAIEAFEFVQKSTDRIDTLQLFSPAFFQDKSEKFKRVQTLNYKKNQTSYEDQFLQNISYPSNMDMREYFKKDSLESLEKLLNFVWEKEKLEQLKSRGVFIEVYLGGNDKIIDTQKAYEFFKEFATLYFIKEGGHILHGEG